MLHPSLSSLRARQLRTRFRPRSRVAHGLVSAAPWINLGLLVWMWTLLESRLILQPGLIVEMPTGPFVSGTPIAGPTLVILSVRGLEGGPRQDVVFFDDERYVLRQSAQMDKLRRALRTFARRDPQAALVIQADRRVSHETVTTVMNLAVESGWKRINLALQPL